MAVRAIFLVSCFSMVLSLQSFWYNVHDGQNRIQELTEADLADKIGTAPLAVVWVRTTPGQDKVIEAVTEQMLQMSAQYLSQQGALVGSLTVAPESTFATDYGLDSNMLLVLKNGRQVVYNGYRSAEVFISFVEKLGDAVLSVIDGKATKKVFDRLKNTKVIGYFEPNDPALADYEAAAQEFLGEIPFYVATDPVVATHLKMNASGEIHVIRQMDKQRLPIPQVPATVDDIRIFLYDHSSAVFNKLAMDNIHSLWENVNENIASVISFSSRDTPLGPPFYKVLKNVARQFANETAIQITVIETDKFPMILPHWESLYNISLLKPALGLVNLTDNNSTWFDISAMNLFTNETEKRAMMSDWFTQIIQGVIRVDGLEPAVPEPVVEEPVVDAATEAEQPAEGQGQAEEGQGQAEEGQGQAEEGQGQADDQQPTEQAEEPKTEL